MNQETQPLYRSKRGRDRTGRTGDPKALVRLLGAIAIIVVGFGLAAAPAGAAYSAKVKGKVLSITGGGAGDQLALRLKFGDDTVLQVDVGDDGTADFSFARSTFSSINVEAAGGDDVVRIDESNGVFTNSQATSLSGGGGDDTLVGGSASETINGGSGDDLITPGRGDDTDVRGGSGADRFLWNPGDGNDVVEGQNGADTLVFRGANIGEVIELSANGGRLRFTRNVANITMDTDGVETVDFRAVGGADLITVGDLTGTDVSSVLLDLAGSVGGGDGAADQVVVNGTAGDDTITVSGSAGNVTVNGLATTVGITSAEPALDTLTVDVPGDDQVIVEGGAGDDAFTVSGGGATLPAVTGLAAAVLVAGADPAGDTLRLNTLGGNDVVNASTLLQDTINFVEDGGSGMDTLLGSLGKDLLLGGDDDDFVDGNRNDDVAFLGAGDDSFNWDPGDGNDVVEGQNGADTLVFRGANIGEVIELSANGGRLRFTRNVANITMDTDGVETVDFRAVGGADLITVGDLTGTDVSSVLLDLAGSVGGGDGAADQVVVNGTAGDDTITVSGSAGNVTVNGLATTVGITSAEPALDTLTVDVPGDDQVIVEGGAGDDAFTVSGGGATLPAVTGLAAAVLVAGADPAGDTLRLNTLGGNDVVNASTLLQDTINFVEDGGSGMDTLLGSLGKDLLLGGDDDDFVDGNRNDDVAFLGAGDDSFNWDPGDGNDVVEGQNGADTLVFRGANIGEVIELSANGGRLRFTRNVANITMDTDGVETVDFRAVGGADLITVGDLTGTDVSSVLLDLAGSVGGGDGAADQVVVNGTAGDDTITVSGSAGNVTVNGLATTVGITSAEPTDQLSIETLEGTDNVDSSGLAAGTIQLLVDGVPV